MYEIVILVFFLFTFTSMAYADELFVSSNMLISGDYQGVFIRDNIKLPQIITLVSNSDIVGIPDSLYIPPDQNHAIFDISLHGIGDVTIIAHDNDTFYNVTASIISDKKKDYNIFLLLPEKTSTSDIMGTVFLVDDFFNPIYAEQDIFVSFAAENIDVPKQLKIASKSSHAFFSANIRGDSWITAYTDQSTSDTLYIDFSMAEKQVHIGVAPDVIAPYSFAYLFVWLSENGIPLEPTLPIKSTLHVSDGAVIGIDGLSETSGIVYLRDGVIMKKLTADNVGESSITVNVPGYGTASQMVYVDNLFNGTDSDTFDIIVANIFPYITTSNAYLVWSLYNEIDSETFPKYGDAGTDFFITSQNLIHDGVVSFEYDQRRTQSNIIPISGNMIGNHTVSISSTVTSGIVTAELEIASPVKYSISVVSLPPQNTEDTRPLFAVSVLDSDGYVVDPHFMFGGLSVTLLSDDIQFANKSIFLDDAVSIIYGISSVSYPTITILANDKDIVVSNSHTPTSHLLVDIQMPKRVHSGEEFPAYAFLTDSNGVPLSDIQEYLQSKCDINNELFSCIYDSEFMVFENAIGFATKTLKVFENQFEYGDISFDLGDGTIGIGSPFVISYTIPTGAALDIVTSISYVINNDNVILTPDSVGKHDVLFIVSKPGFETHHTNTSYLVSDEIHLTVKTVTSTGVVIPSSVSVSRMLKLYLC